MKQKVIVVSSRNLTPEEEIEKKLAKYGDDWFIVSAKTSLALSTMFWEQDVYHHGIASGQHKHVYYVTTVIIEKK
ncbi:MAG: hypothetical protein WC933_03420 [Candidatus Paceibacterota bacterium]|jgi:hypothetical protein